MYGHGGGGYGRSRFNDKYKDWKPPLPPDYKLSNIPLWEKRFCTDSFKINWDVFMNKKSWAQYDIKIPEWDDSAGKEAYRNARERYWAKYHHAPCNIPLPDPNMYINKVDHDCHLDPEIIAMLEDDSPPVNCQGQGPVVLGIESISKDNQWMSGWGEMEPPPVQSGWCEEEARKPTGWGEFDDCPEQPIGWGDAEAQPTGWGNDQADGWGTSLPSLKKEHYSSNHGYNNGWEDAQHNENKEARKPTGWGEFDDCPEQPTGWGDAEAQPTGWVNDQADGWGTALPSLKKEHYSSNHGYNNGWEDAQHNKNNDRDGWNNCGWNNGWEENHQNKDSGIDGWNIGWEGHNSNKNWGNEQQNDGWRDNPGWGQLGGRDNHRSDARGWSYNKGSNNNHQFSRYKVSRYQEPNDEYRLKSNGWRNGGSRKRGGTFEKPEVVKQRSVGSWQWNSVPCRNGNKRADAWRWEKPVL